MPINCLSLCFQISTIVKSTTHYLHQNHIFFFNKAHFCQVQPKRRSSSFFVRSFNGVMSENPSIVSLPCKLWSNQLLLVEAQAESLHFSLDQHLVPPLCTSTIPHLLFSNGKKTRTKPPDSQTQTPQMPFTPSQSSFQLAFPPSLKKRQKSDYKHIFPYPQRYNLFMRIILTIIACLLFAQYAAGLRLHTQTDDLVNATASTDVDVDGPISDDASGKEEDDITERDIKETQQNYDAIKQSGNAEIIAKAKEAKNEFKATAAAIKEKIDQAGEISEDATEEEIQAALNTIDSSVEEFTEAFKGLSKKVADLRAELNANASVEVGSA